MEVSINGKWKLELPDWRAKFYRDHGGSWEAVRLEEMAKLTKPGMIIYDVGAEHGDFTALYKLWVKDGSVVIIEPSPPYWGIIKKIWDMNFTDRPLACFSGFASNVDDYSQESFDYPPEAHEEGTPEFGFRHLCQQADSTPQIKLDTLARYTKAPNIVVIDTEGSEYNVLEGSIELMQTKRPIFFVSIHEPTLKEWYNKTPDDIHNLMESFNYTKKYLGKEIEDFWVYQPK